MGFLFSEEIKLGACILCFNWLLSVFRIMSKLFSPVFCHLDPLTLRTLSLTIVVTKYILQPKIATFFVIFRTVFRVCTWMLTPILSYTHIKKLSTFKGLPQLSLLLKPFFYIFSSPNLEVNLSTSKTSKFF